MVTSGFGEGTDWDEWYGGVSAGWDFELRSLQHYLERHPGQDRAIATVRAPLAADRPTSWARLTGPGGWLARTGLTGRELLRAPPVQLVMTVEQHDDALMRVELEMGNHAIVWLAAWGVAPEAIAGLQAEWRTTFREALGER